MKVLHPVLALAQRDIIIMSGGRMTVENPNQVRDFECEVCGKTANITNQEAFNDGWDWPPWIGAPGVVAPRTCGDCTVDGTVWWALMVVKQDPETLTQKQMDFIEAINAEVE